MYLLTPVNVIVNVEDIQMKGNEGEFDFLIWDDKSTILFFNSYDLYSMDIYSLIWWLAVMSWFERLRIKLGR